MNLFASLREAPLCFRRAQSITKYSWYEPTGAKVLNVEGMAAAGRDGEASGCEGLGFKMVTSKSWQDIPCWAWGIPVMLTKIYSTGAAPRRIICTHATRDRRPSGDDGPTRAGTLYQTTSNVWQRPPSQVHLI